MIRKEPKLTTLIWWIATVVTVVVFTYAMSLPIYSGITGEVAPWWFDK